MEAVGKFFAGPVGSWLRVFAAVSLGLYLADLQSDEIALSVTEYLEGGLVAVLPIIVAWLNPGDPRFGKGSS
jgi:hypothetical protein